MTQHRYLFILIATQLILSQRNNFRIPDSLRNKNFEYLDDKIYLYRGDSSKASVYMYTYLYKAKTEQNYREIVNGYQNILHESPEEQRLIYADSMILAAQKSGMNSLLGSAYLSKGIVYYSKKELHEALDNYIEANKYIYKTSDQYLKFKVKYNIAVIKSYLGYYDEAISLLIECVDHFKDEESRPYLNSLHALGLSYNKIGNYGKCNQTNLLGISESERLGNKDMIPYFIHSEAVNQFFKEDYNDAIKNLKSVLDQIKKNEDFASESISCFYIGKSYWRLKNYEDAVSYFLKVDQIFKSHGYIRPDLRETYELLIKYYKTQNNLDAQLYCIDQLLLADNYLNETYKYLVSKLHKEYDTNELIFEKEKIQEQFIKKKKQVYAFTGLALALLLLSLFLTFNHFRNRRLYKKNFDQLMLQLNSGKVIKDKFKTATENLTDINPETVSHIIKQLKKFENEKKFLQKDLTISKLAVMFNSNQTYVSRIIRNYSGKVFKDYINDLKIEHIIDLLHNDKKIRKYNNLALAEEAGFGSKQLFAQLFKAKTGMPTAYFIEQLRTESL
ncbi:AraC family transcriptional regulator [Flavobacterium olei]|uniref:AraC family transcriptional regulator n=1 Tax=Flavobacterium olei TaxID=1886782 RepID=UPI0032198467